jgi:hypothetical protein
MANGVSGWLEAHPTEALGGGVILALVVGGYLLSRKGTITPATASTTPSSDLSGLSTGPNGPLVYVPTSESFQTYNDTSSTLALTQTPGGGNITLSGPTVVGNQTPTTNVNIPTTNVTPVSVVHAPITPGAVDPVLAGNVGGHPITTGLPTLAGAIAQQPTVPGTIGTSGGGGGIVIISNPGVGSTITGPITGVVPPTNPVASPPPPVRKPPVHNPPKISFQWVEHVTAHGQNLNTLARNAQTSQNAVIDGLNKANASSIPHIAVTAQQVYNNNKLAVDNYMHAHKLKFSLSQDMTGVSITLPKVVVMGSM